MHKGLGDGGLLPQGGRRVDVPQLLQLAVGGKLARLRHAGDEPPDDRLAGRVLLAGNVPAHLDPQLDECRQCPCTGNALSAVR